MQVLGIGTAFASKEPSAAGAWFTEHLGFHPLVDLGWYVSTQHPDHDGLRVDFVRHDHATWVEPSAGVRGAMLAFVVPDVDTRHELLVAAGVPILKEPVTEPWGQRRLQVTGPDGLVVELVQPVEPDPEWMAAQGISV